MQRFLLNIVAKYATKIQIKRRKTNFYLQFFPLYLNICNLSASNLMKIKSKIVNAHSDEPP